MFKAIVFVFLVISFMLIFGKLAEFINTTIIIIKRFIRKRKPIRAAKIKDNKKERIKKQFEAKGWRIAK